MATTMLDFTKPHLLRNDEEYQHALVEVNELMIAEPAEYTAEFERLEFLGLLIEAYEEANFPIDDPSPEAIVDFALEQKGMRRADLAESMGGASRVSDFFNGKRGLSIGQIKKLRELLGIQADLLIPAE